MRNIFSFMVYFLFVVCLCSYENKDQNNPPAFNPEFYDKNGTPLDSYEAGNPYYTFIPDKESVAFKEIPVLYFKSNKMTVGKRTPPEPQIKCVGGSAGCSPQILPSLVVCKNSRVDNQSLFSLSFLEKLTRKFFFYKKDVEWKCDAHMKAGLVLSNPYVNCEGYSKSGDSNILKGSCMVEIEIEKDSNYASTRQYDSPSKASSENDGNEPQRKRMYTSDDPQGFHKDIKERNYKENYERDHGGVGYYGSEEQQRREKEDNRRFDSESHSYFSSDNPHSVENPHHSNDSTDSTNFLIFVAVVAIVIFAIIWSFNQDSQNRRNQNVPRRVN